MGVCYDSHIKQTEGDKMIAAFVGLCVLAFIVLFMLFVICVYEALFGEVED